MAGYKTLWQNGKIKLMANTNYIFATESEDYELNTDDIKDLYDVIDKILSNEDIWDYEAIPSDGPSMRDGIGR